MDELRRRSWRRSARRRSFNSGQRPGMQHGALEILLGLLGLCVGSFLNVVIYRWPRGLSIAKPARSFCPTCNKTIAWYENIPVLSWLFLRGKCGGCGSIISAQYPLIEAVT